MHNISDIVEKFIKEIKEKNNYNNQVEKEIIDYIGPESVKNIVRKEIQKDQIMLYFGSSSFAYDFNLKKEELLKKIQKSFPEIKQIKTKIG